MPDDEIDESAGSTDVDSPPNADYPGEPVGQSSLDDYLHLLANERRRLIITFLADRPGEPVPVDRLEDLIVEREWPDRGPVTHRERVSIDLHHVQLPKLADADAVEYDPVDGTVQYDGPALLADLLATTNALEGDE